MSVGVLCIYLPYNRIFKIIEREPGSGQTHTRRLTQTGMCSHAHVHTHGHAVILRARVCIVNLSLKRWVWTLKVINVSEEVIHSKKEKQDKTANISKAETSQPASAAACPSAWPRKDGPSCAHGCHAISHVPTPPSWLPITALSYPDGLIG